MFTAAPPSRRAFSRTFTLLCFSLVFVSAALAQALPNPKITFDVPAGEAKPMLRQFAAQAKREIVFAPEAVNGVRTLAVKGEMSPQEAVDRMLEGTGLIAAQDPKTGAFAVRPATPDESKNVSRAITPDRDRPVSRVEVGEDGERIVKLDTFEVFGRKTLNMDIKRSRDDAQPYVVLGRNEIEMSGAQDVQELLTKNVTMLTATTDTKQSTSIMGNVSSFRLRGQETLVLIDGRRVPSIPDNSQGIRQGDLNGIPLSAIERIEVLPTTASGIYGGTATGGVINVVLRRDYIGFETRLTYGNTFETDVANRRVDFSGGFSFNRGRTSVLLAATASDKNALVAQDRDFVARLRRTVLANNPSALLTTVPLGGTTNIRGQNGALLTLKASLNNGVVRPLGSAITFIPVGYTGASSDGGAALLANAGTYNFDLADTAQISGGGRAYMLNAPEVASLMGSIRHQFTSALEAFVDLSASTNESSFFAADNTTFTVSSTVAANPFNQNVVVNTPLYGFEAEFRSRVESRRGVAGVIAKLPHEWRLGVDYTYNWNRYRNGRDSISATGITSGITGGTINPFQDATDTDFSSFKIEGNSQQRPSITTIGTAALRLGGSVYDLPAGPVGLSILAEDLRQKFHRLSTGTSTGATVVVIPERRQVSQSFYAEAKVPVFSPANRRPGLELLEFQLAGRFDQFTTYGATAYTVAVLPTDPPIVKNRRTSANPTIALRYQPLSSVTVRASFGTGFIPPNVNQLVEGTATILDSATAALLNLRDPKRGNEVLGTSNGGSIRSLNGGLPDLQPETSTSWSAGVIFTPRRLLGLRLSVDWTRIEKKDKISALGIGSTFLALEDMIPGYVTRGPVPPGDPYGVGPITTLDPRTRNISAASDEELDFTAEYEWTTADGRFRLTGSATRLLEREDQLTPGSAIIVDLGSVNALRWSASGNLQWERGPWTVQWSTRFYDRYWLNAATHAINASQGSATVPSQTYHDVTLRYGFPSQANRWLRNTDLQVGVNNVFNTTPPLDVTQITAYGYSGLGDPRLANYFVSLRRRF